MSASVPTIEPLSARAGDTWRWQRGFADYPAPTWALTYRFFNAASVFVVTASADGSNHLVDDAPEATAGRVAGRYDWIASVSNGVDRFQVAAGSLTVFPDLSTAASYDGRTHARKMLDALNAILEGRATDGDIDVVNSATGKITTQWDVAELRKLRQQYAAAVRSEDEAAARARGEPDGRMLRVRFVP